MRFPVLYYKRKFQSQMYLSLLWGQSLEPLSTANSWPPPLAPIKKVKASHCMWYYYFEKVFFRYLIPVPYYNATVRHLFNTRPPPSAPIKNSKHCTDMEPLSPNICIPPLNLEITKFEKLYYFFNIQNLPVPSFGSASGTPLPNSCLPSCPSFRGSIWNTWNAVRRKDQFPLWK